MTGKRLYQTEEFKYGMTIAAVIAAFVMLIICIGLFTVHVVVPRMPSKATPETTPFRILSESDGIPTDILMYHHVRNVLGGGLSKTKWFEDYMIEACGLYWYRCTDYTRPQFAKMMAMLDMKYLIVRECNHPLNNTDFIHVHASEINPAYLGDKPCMKRDGGNDAFPEESDKKQIHVYYNLRWGDMAREEMILVDA